MRVKSLAFFDLLAFSAQKFMGSRDPSHAPCSKIFSGVMSGLSMAACVPNLKFVPLAVLELLTFNVPKFTELRDPGHAPLISFYIRGLAAAK